VILDMDATFIIRQLVISAIPVLIAITFHELSHGVVAKWLGDSTAKMMGRLTINPLAHIDLFGTIIMPALLLIFTNGQFVFGYAKPVPINPMNFKNPRRDMAISAGAGPLMNILLAVASMIILKFIVLPLSVALPVVVSKVFLKPLTLMLSSSIIINIVLAAFNLIPIPPLDGGRIVVGLLPQRQAYSYGKIEPYGFIIVIILIATGIAGYIISPIMEIIWRFVRLF